MSTTAVIFSPVYYRHNPGRGHPESARRLRAIVREFKTSKLQGIGNWRFVEPEKACTKDVKLVHGIEYIKLVACFVEGMKSRRNRWLLMFVGRHGEILGQNE